jgi:nucleotide-binding universal stress UspA family protein
MTASTFGAAMSSPEASGSGHEPVLVAMKPYDGFDTVLAMAKWIATAQNRPLHAVTVVEPHDTLAIAAGVPVVADYRAEERSAIADLLEERLDHDTAGLDLEQRVDVLEGPAAESVVDLAHDRGAHAIVVGTGQHNPIGRFVYGERAVQISRLSDRPVVVVPSAAKIGPVREAIVAVDFSPASQRAARFALDLIADEGELVLVHVKSAVNLSDEGAGWWEEAYRKRTTDLFRRFTALLRPGRGIRVTTRLLHGDVADSILAYARHDAGLIACGGRQHSFIERMLLGSVSTQLIRRAECPVVVVPDRGVAEPTEESASAVGGVVESWDANAWAGLIERFGRRNAGRPTQLRFKTASPQGAGSLEQGYRLVDATFDRAAARAEIVLTDPDSSNLQVSHRISNVRAVMVSTDASGRDTSLRLDTATGRCTVTLGD